MYLIGTFIMQDSASIYGNATSKNGGGVYIGSGNFFISNGIIYGNSSGAMSNTAANSGAALFRSAVALYGTFSGDIFTPNGILDTTDDTIEVVNGVLQ